MRYLITGGAGFIGSHYVRGLLDGSLGEFPDEVLVVDKLTYAGNIANLDDVSMDSRMKLHVVDICDADAIGELLKDIDVVVNFAAETHVDRSIAKAADFVLTNVLGAQTVMEQSRVAGVGRVVHIGTDEVYGSIASGSWVEDSPLLPNSPYSAAKASAELMARAYHRTYGLNISTTRCSNNYGPNQHPEKLIPLFVTNLMQGKSVPLYGDGTNTRDWLHVSDHCRGIHTVVAHGTAGESYNIGGGTELTNLEITEKILDAMGAPWSMVAHVEDRLGHDLRYSVDDSKLRELGYRPQVDFASGLDQTITWYRDHEDWWRSALGIG